MSKLPILAGLGLTLASTLTAQVTITPLFTFGSNGWLAPGSSAYLSTGDTERGLGLNPVTGNLVLVARQNVNGAANNVVVLDGANGAVLGVLDTTGISGGTLPVNMVDCNELGQIYACNLSTSATSPFKVYRWDDETLGVAPTVAFSGMPGVERTGDAFAVTVDADGVPVFAAAGTNNVNASNFLVGSSYSPNGSRAFLSIPGTNTSSNDYRLSLTFVASALGHSTMIGTQGGLAQLTHCDSVSGNVWLQETLDLGGSTQRGLDYTVIGSTPLLACIDANSSTVSVFSLRNPSAPLLLGTANATTGALAGNPNGTGSVQWGPVTGNSATLYAMSTNQGIQAFTVTLGPLASTTAYGAGCDGLTLDPVGTPSIAAPFFRLRLSVQNTAPVGFFGLGTVVIDPGIPLAGLGLPGCSAYTNLDIGLLSRPAAMIAELPLPIPANVALAGQTLSAQGVSFSTATALGLKTSNGVRIDVGF